MKISGIVLFVLFVFSFSEASARDDWTMFPIQDAMNTADAKQKLNQGVKFYFGSQTSPKVLQSFGEFQSNKKTNSFNKSDKQACEWAFLSAMLSFQQRALSMGANAVTNIKSYYKKHLVDSPTEYECGAGTFVSGVTFKGTVVKVAQ
jgi:uncharacterized protein YbjQ (UPF0145 family)